MPQHTREHGRLAIKLPLQFQAQKSTATQTSLPGYIRTLLNTAKSIVYASSQLNILWLLHPRGDSGGPPRGKVDGETHKLSRQTGDPAERPLETRRDGLQAAAPMCESDELPGVPAR